MKSSAFPSIASSATWPGSRPHQWGGISDINIPRADLNKEIGTAFNILDDEGKALRGLYLIDPDGVIVHATINNLPVGRNVDETLRLLQHSNTCSPTDEVCLPTGRPVLRAGRSRDEGVLLCDRLILRSIEFGIEFIPKGPFRWAFFMAFHHHDAAVVKQTIQASEVTGHRHCFHH